MVLDLKVFLLENITREGTENYFALYCSIILCLYDKSMHLMVSVLNPRVCAGQSVVLNKESLQWPNKFERLGCLWKQSPGITA